MTVTSTSPTTRMKAAHTCLNMYLCKPIFLDDSAPIAFVVCIAHHTDIGGKNAGWKWL